MPTLQLPTTTNTEIVRLIDDAMLLRQRGQERRSYLGPSRWGDECSRKLGHEFHGTPIEGDQFPAHILRVFDMGHDGEARVAAYLKLAGFDLHCHDTGGRQFGFSVLDGKLKGHCDGIIHGGPIALPYPLLWENKALSNKSFADCQKKGVKISKPLYYAQMQAYCAYFDLPGGAFFTAINRDTGHIHAEHVPFDPECAQEVSDRALRVVQSDNPEELPRISDDPDFWQCRFCSFHGQCHNLNITPTP